MTKLQHLRFLVALDAQGNFSRAAAQCHVTQSTLSSGLKEMEARLGVALAERTTHSVMMTPVGQELAGRARDILAQVADFEECARDEANGAGSLRFGIIPTIGPYLLPRALPMLRALKPQMRYYLREELTQHLVEGLLDGRLDLILIALPHDLPAHLETGVLFEDGYSLATPRAHPLANLEQVTGADLEGRELLLLERGHCLQQHALSSLPEVKLSEDASFSATSLPTLVAMVEEGLGVTLLPDLATDGGLTMGHNIHLAGLLGATPRQVALAWRKSTAKTDQFRAIGEALKQARRAVRETRTAG